MQKIEIKIELHSVVLLVGPSNCGKSTFVKNTLIPKLQEQDSDKLLNIGYISSDDIRRELLGRDFNKYDDRMTEVSSVAFDEIYHRLESYLRFPVKKEVVIVDTTGLNEDFRSKISNICETNNYKMNLLMFEYKNKEDYNLFGDVSNKLMFRHITKIKDFYKARKNYNSMQKIKSHPSKNEFDIIVENYDFYSKCNDKTTDYNYFVIGDIHGCIDELKQLLINNHFEIENDIIKRTDKTSNVKIISIGDYLDKGSSEKITETIEFIHKNMFNTDSNDLLTIVNGNHERKNYSLLTGISSPVEEGEEVMRKYYGSYKLLVENVVLKNKFFDIYKVSLPFFQINRSYGSYYITHAPCEQKFIGKIDNKSIKKQNYYYVDKNQSMYDNLKRFMTIDSFNHPIHIFGHIALKDVYDGAKSKNNLIGIDTGCVHGGKITGYKICEGHYNNTSSVNFMNNFDISKKVLERVTKPNIYSEPDSKEKIKMSEDAEKKVKYITRNKINTISGTVCPANKKEEEGIFESLLEGANYFLENNVMNICAQPKYMGSRCQVYLFPNDISKSYMVSRNGHVIKNVPKEKREEIFSILENRLSKFILDNKLQLLIIDGELMPWSAMGDGLIKERFLVIEDGIDSENDILKKSGFEEKLKELTEELETTEYKSDFSRLPKKEMSEKYEKNKTYSYSYLINQKSKYQTLDEEKESIDVYKQQMILYAKSKDDIHYKAFGLLKVVTEDNKEYIIGTENNKEFPEGLILNQSQIFKMLSDEECLSVNLNEENWFNNLQEFYTRMTSENLLEGLVLKNEKFVTRLSNFIKVRNDEYLSIIYGFNYKFPHNFNKLIKNKSITSKLRQAIKEYHLGLKMLEQPYNSIDKEDNQEFVKYLVKFIDDEQRHYIDPRL